MYFSQLKVKSFSIYNGKLFKKRTFQAFASHCLKRAKKKIWLPVAFMKVVVYFNNNSNSVRHMQRDLYIFYFPYIKYFFCLTKANVLKVRYLKRG